MNFTKANKLSLKGTHDFTKQMDTKEQHIEYDDIYQDGDCHAKFSIQSTKPGVFLEKKGAKNGQNLNILREKRAPVSFCHLLHR